MTVTKIKNTKKYGRGLYSLVNLSKGQCVEESEVVILNDIDSKMIESTDLNMYSFAWKSGSAIALGKGSLFNHSKTPNVTYFNDYEDKVIYFIAIRDIKKGEQLFIDYGYDPIKERAVTKKNRQRNIDFFCCECRRGS